MQPGAVPKPAKKQGELGKAIVGIVLGLVFVMIVVSALNGKWESPSPAPSSSDAVLMCHQFIDKQLKAPSTADYESVSEANVVAVGESFTVAGHVDSENSFGAKLRSSYVCKVTHTPGTDNWHLNSLTGIK